MKMPKTGKVNGKPCEGLEDARRPIGAGIEAVRDTRRLHSARGQDPPVAFEEHSAAQPKADAERRTPRPSMGVSRRRGAVQKGHVTVFSQHRNKNVQEP